MTETAKKKTPRDLLRVMFRRRYLFLLGAALFAVVTLVVSHYVPLQYTGTTRFQRRTDPSATEAQQGVESFENQKLTLGWELAGYNAMARAVEELGLVKGPRGPDGKLNPKGEADKQDLVNEMLQSVGVHWDVRTTPIDQVALSFTHPDPDIAEKMPNALVKNYINSASQIIIDRLDGSRLFLEKQVKICAEEVTKLTDAKYQFEADHADAMFDSPSQLREQILRTSTAIDVLRMREKLAQTTVEELGGQVTEFEKFSAESKPVREVIGPNPRRVELENQVQILEERLINYKVNMTDKHPAIVATRERIAFLKGRIEGMPKEVVLQKVIEPKELPPDRRKDLQQAQLSLDDIRKSMRVLIARVETLDKAIGTFSTTRQEYLALTGRVIEKEAELRQWTDRLRQVRVALQAELNERRTHLRTVQAAQRQTRPSSPSWWRIVVLAILGGLAFGAALVLLANFMDRSIATPEDAMRHFNIPVHGVIGEILTAARRSRRRLARWILTPTVSFLVLLALGLCLLSITLHLQYPEKYKEWRADPVEYVMDGISTRARNLID